MTSLANEKLNRLQNLMRTSKIDIVIIPLGVNFHWLFGIKEVPSERLLISIIEPEGSPKFLVPSFEAERIQKATKAKDVVGWGETENPFGRYQRINAPPNGTESNKDPSTGKQTPLNSKTQDIDYSDHISDTTLSVV